MANKRVRLQQDGFSLVEFMIAISLGLLIVGVIIGIFVSGNRNYAQDERHARLQENARFAMRTLTSDIANDSFWGSMTDLNILNAKIQAYDPGCSLIANGKLDPKNTLINNTNNSVLLADATAAAIETQFPCITDAQDGSSVLVIKRVQGTCLSGDANLTPPCAAQAPIDNKVYLRTNGTDGFLFTANAHAAAPGSYRDWEFIPRIYYIRRYSVSDGDGIPTLTRKVLQGGAMVSEALVDGIEQFRISPGVSSAVGQPLPVQVHILARSLDRDPAYDTDRAGVKTYTLGYDNLGDPKCFSVSAVAGCTQLTTADGTPQNYYRRVFSSVIAARNPGLLE